MKVCIQQQYLTARSQKQVHFFAKSILKYFTFSPTVLLNYTCEFEGFDMALHREGDMRRYERRSYSEPIACSIDVLDVHENKNLNHTARDIYKRDGGIGIETDYPLAPGHTLWFHGIHNRTGVVRWYAKCNDGYRIGIQITSPNAASRQEKPSQDVVTISGEIAAYARMLDVAVERLTEELTNIEKRCADPAEAGEELLDALKHSADRVLSVCAEVERVLRDKDMISEARLRFHEKTDPILSKSYLIKRTRTWPQGYQGDYKTLETIYRKTPHSSGIGYYLDVMGLNAPLAEGVRNRIKKLSEILRWELLERQQPLILNIACGSCRELMEIAPEIISSRARITCVDNDNDALAFAQDRLTYAGVIEQVELRKYNALRMFDDEMNLMEFGSQDVIYSVGLFDYLPDDFLVKLLRALYNLLRPKGKLIAAFKDAARYRSQDYHWFCHWDGFLQRKEGDFLRILMQAGIPDSSLSASREDSGIIVFYTATK
jgi:extracellular factor (EF) 3-hydroxypalmitic acid methyl ester biosynthesis protein